MQGEIGESEFNKLQTALERKPGYSTFRSVCQIQKGNNVDPPEDISLKESFSHKFSIYYN